MEGQKSTVLCVGLPLEVSFVLAMCVSLDLLLTETIYATQREYSVYINYELCWDENSFIWPSLSHVHLYFMSVL